MKPTFGGIFWNALTKSAIQILLLATLSACTADQDKAVSNESRSAASASSNKRSIQQETNNLDLTFLGTVVSIEIADTGSRLKNWVVTAKVDKILIGNFSGNQFTFAVHSPALSGLEVGKQYRMRAAKDIQVFSPEQNQWRSVR